MHFSATPAPQGLYDPQYEQDACGVAAIADIKGRRSHRIVADGITALINLDHRGAAGADPAVGDGAGILIQVPEELFRAVCDFELPAAPTRGTARPSPPGSPSCRADADARAEAKDIVAEIVAGRGPRRCSAGAPCRPIPVSAGVGQMALDVMPVFEQLFSGRAGRRRRHPAVRARRWTG